MARFSKWWIKVAIVLLFICSNAHGITIENQTPWQAIFAGKVVPYSIKLTAKQNTVTSLNWTLSAKGRVLSTGQQVIRFNNKTDILVPLPLQTPPVKPGIVVDAQLTVTLSDEAGQQKGHSEINLAIYGPNVLLANPRLNFDLFDPVGQTAKTLNDLNIPYDLKTKDQLSQLTLGRLLIVGAGVGLERQRGLVDIVVELAESGHRVLVLEPDSGRFPVSSKTSSSMALADYSVISSFAKKHQWISPDPVKTRGIAIQSHRQAISAQIVESQQSHWIWYRLNFLPSGGQLIVCMLPFSKYVDEGPIPQIIFGQLLVYASGQRFGLTKSTQGN